MRALQGKGFLQEQQNKTLRKFQDDIAELHGITREPDMDSDLEYIGAEKS
jgi:hypothetical protein